MHALLVAAAARVSYYDREQAEHTDGTPIFLTDEDEAAERAVAEQLEGKWRCELRRWGKLAPLDWYAVRDERLIGVVELKARSHARERFPTVFLNVRKWLALLLAQQGLGVHATFVVAFADGVWWVPVRLAMGDHEIVDARKRSHGKNDSEPVIAVPVSALQPL